MSHRSPYRALLSLTSLALLLVLTGLFHPRAVHAAPPPPLTGDPDGVTINPDGGTNDSNGLRIDVYNTQYQVFRDNRWQVYEDTAADAYNDWALWLLPPDPNTSYGGYRVEMLVTPQLPTPAFNSPNDFCEWSDTNGICFTDNSAPQHTLETPATLGADTWRATVVISGNDLYTLTLTYDYTSPNPYFDLTAKLERKSGNTHIPQDMHLYFVGDLALSENDDGPTFEGTYDGKPVYGQYSPADVSDAFSGMTPIDGFRPTSVYLGTYECAGDGTYGIYPDDGIDYAGCTGSGPGNEQDPAYGEPFNISWEDYQTDYIDAGESIDAGMGMHWDLNPTASSWTKKVRLLYSDYAWFESNVSLEALPEEEAEEEAGAEAADCVTAPTMRLVPDPLTIAPGTSETLWVEVVNSCTDRPLSAADLLVSFDNGLTAAGDGWLTLGQRIALQGLTLAPGELRAWPLTFTAAPDAAAPLNLVGEVYFAGSRAASIAHSVTVPAPAVVAAPAPPAAPVVALPVAEPAPLPAALPNTGNDMSIAYTLLALFGTAVAVIGLQLRRRRV